MFASLLTAASKHLDGMYKCVLKKYVLKKVIPWKQHLENVTIESGYFICYIH